MQESANWTNVIFLSPTGDTVVGIRSRLCNQKSTGENAALRHVAEPCRKALELCAALVDVDDASRYSKGQTSPSQTGKNQSKSRISVYLGELGVF